MSGSESLTDKLREEYRAAKAHYAERCGAAQVLHLQGLGDDGIQRDPTALAVAEQAGSAGLRLDAAVRALIAEGAREGCTIARWDYDESDPDYIARKLLPED